MNIGFSVILNTTDEQDVQKLAQIMQVFADQSNTVSHILVSKAVRWDADNAAVTNQGAANDPIYGAHPAGL